MAETAPPVQTCGTTWGLCPSTYGLLRLSHVCERPDNHEHDMLLRQPPQCRCRCGATTTREAG